MLSFEVAYCNKNKDLEGIVPETFWDLSYVTQGQVHGLNRLQILSDLTLIPEQSIQMV